jgi:hypothetical protein
VRLARSLDPDRGRGGCRQARIARLPDLDGAVVDELRDREAGGGGDDRPADRALRGEDGAGPRRHPNGQVAYPQQTPFERREQTKEPHRARPQPAPRTPPPAGRRDPPVPHRAGEVRPGPHHQAINLAVDLASQRFRPHPHDQCAATNRCYHRPSLRLLFRSSFRRARKGLFHAPIPAANAGRL